MSYHREKRLIVLNGRKFGFPTLSMREKFVCNNCKQPYKNEIKEQSLIKG